MPRRFRFAMSSKYIGCNRNIHDKAGQRVVLKLEVDKQLTVNMVEEKAQSPPPDFPYAG